MLRKKKYTVFSLNINIWKMQWSSISETGFCFVFGFQCLIPTIFFLCFNNSNTYTNVFTFLLKAVTERHTEDERKCERERALPFIGSTLNQMSAKAKAKSTQRQDSAASFTSTTWVQGPWLCAILWCFSRLSQWAGSEVEEPELNVVSILYAATWRWLPPKLTFVGYQFLNLS